MPSLKDLFNTIVDLPKDIILDLPRITMVGNLQLVIENHRGILEFEGQEVRIMLEHGNIRIKGDNLTLRSIQVDEIVVDGSIKELVFEDDQYAK